MDKIWNNRTEHWQFGNFSHLQLPTGSAGLLSLLPPLCTPQAFACPTADGAMEAAMADTYLLPLDKPRQESEV